MSSTPTFGQGMPEVGLFAVLGSVLLISSCTTTIETTLPALDASETLVAEALVTQSDYSRGFEAPGHVIRGAGEGATSAMGAYLAGGITGDEPGLDLIQLILAPVGLPVSAAIGAGKAHSEEEVDAAIAAFNKVGQDEELFTSIDHRFIEALDKDSARHWACIEAASVAAPAPCSGYMSVARVVFRPEFRLQADGAYNPDILFIGDIVISVSVNSTAPSAITGILLEVKWRYREELGKFRELAKDDALLLRRKIDSILDRFANRIAEDLYLDPQPETFSTKHESSGMMFTVMTEGAVVRVEQGTEVSSVLTHGVVAPKGRPFTEKCWIVSIDGKPTGHNYDTPWMSRNVAIEAGRVRLDVSCLNHRGSFNEKLEEHSIEVVVNPGVRYVTNGQMFEREIPVGP